MSSKFVLSVNLNQCHMDQHITGPMRSLRLRKEDDFRHMAELLRLCPPKTKEGLQGSTEGAVYDTYLNVITSGLLPRRRNI